MICTRAPRRLAAQSFLMYNLVCLEEENPWLGLVDVPLLNQRLAHKRGAFERMVIAASRSSRRPAGCALGGNVIGRCIL